jgi:hypothetical protein
MNDEQKSLGRKQMMDTAASRNRRPNASRSAKLSRDVQARLGQQLRAMYDDVVSQGVPDRFTELLNRLNGNDNKDRH